MAARHQCHFCISQAVANQISPGYRVCCICGAETWDPHEWGDEESKQLGKEHG